MVKQVYTCDRCGKNSEKVMDKVVMPVLRENRYRKYTEIEEFDLCKCCCEVIAGQITSNGYMDIV